MSDWLNRTTKQYLTNRSPSDMAIIFSTDVPFIDGFGGAASNLAWILDPDISAVTGFNSRYWEIIGDIVSLKSQTERDTIDVAVAATALASDRTVNKARYENEKALKAIVLLMLDEINILRAQHSLSDRTPAQAKTAFNAKVDSLG